MHEPPQRLRPPMPSAANDFLAEHVGRLVRSYRHWTGTALIESDDRGAALARGVFRAPFVLVSHDTAADPVFNYANRAALELFEMSWEGFVALPSRLSAEPMNREQRERLLDEVARNGYIADYSGVRISASGQRFRINAAVVWNVVDEYGRYCGQAARFSHWQRL